MIWPFSKSRRRARFRELPFPAEWIDYAGRALPYVAALPDADRGRLFAHTRVLLEEKHFEGCGGFKMTDEARVTIAVQAAVLILNLPDAADYYPRLSSIVVYPEVFGVDLEYEGEDGVVSVDDEERSGESWDLGVIVLAWDEVIIGAGRPADGYNVVLHEFAHQLDQEDGLSEGAPALLLDSGNDRWGEVFADQYDRFTQMIHRRRRTFIDPYGAEDPAEFFAVVTETFFERPLELRVRHAELYNVLRDYYRQDPARVFEAAGYHLTAPARR